METVTDPLVITYSKLYIIDNEEVGVMDETIVVALEDAEFIEYEADTTGFLQY
ncbi:MAG TPA: hypothetical protein VIM70_09765 [Clostridium sp.]|uniref:hypothetical protein n=1 Tax=Clostridium sp. TaxID=1506 RepID=UPI002F923263